MNSLKTAKEGYPHLIPAFDRTGGLPVGRYQCTLSEAKKVLVDDLLATSQIRNDIWNAFRASVNLMKSLPCDIPSVFLGGTFATNKLDPSDVDLTFLIDRDSTPQPFSPYVIKQTLISIRAATADKVDCYAIPWEPFNNKSQSMTEEQYQKARGWWDDWWQRDVAKPDRDPFERHHAFPRRGYLEVIIDGYR